MSDEKSRILKERARVLAVESSMPVDQKGSVEVVTFLLADEAYGIETDYVREVNPITEITPVPCTPRFIRGIINVRGRILSVIDLKMLVDLPGKEIAGLNRVIVVEDGEREFGILADRLSGIASFDPGELQPLPPDFGGAGSELIKGIAPGGLIYLDISKLLHTKSVMVHEEVAG